MDIARLNMRSQMAKLNLETTPLKVEYEIEPAKLDLSTQPAKVEISHTEGKVEMNCEQWRYTALGRKTMAAFARDVAQAGAQGASEAIDRIVSEGNQLAAPPSQGSTPADISAGSNFLPWPEVDLAVVTPPEITYTPGKTDVQYSPGKVQNNSTRPSFDMKVERGTVKGYVDPKQSLTQWVTMNEYDIYK